MSDRNNQDKSTMLNRRRFVSVAALALLAAPQTAMADLTDAAASFVDKLLKDLSGIVNGGKPIPEQQTALRRIVLDNVDVDGVARFCLGRFWRTATPDQQKNYLEAFRTVLVANITGKVGEYKGVTFSVGRAQKREEDVIVASVVSRPSNAPNKVDWLVSTVGGATKVIDVIAEGTSLRLTQRGDYAAFLGRNNNDISALIEAMKKQTSPA